MNRLDFITVSTQFWMGLIIVVAILATLMTIAFILNKKKSKDKKLEKVAGVEETNNVRYSLDTKEEDNNGNPNISLTKEDITLIARRSYTVSKINKVIPGQYTILSTNETQTKINIRIDGLTREFEHNSKIVLSEGETICPVSCSIILR
jgi:hypothetical protein